MNVYRVRDTSVGHCGVIAIANDEDEARQLALPIYRSHAEEHGMEYDPGELMVERLNRSPLRQGWIWASKVLET